MNAHTPGKWSACSPGDYSDFDGKSIVILSDDPPIRIAVVQGDDEEAKANAALFAAAPDLLEAAQWSANYIDTIVDPTALKVLESLRAAIAKAIGEPK